MLRKRSISIEGHATSIALEPEFWVEVERLARLNGQSIAAFVGAVDEARGNANLASALRLAVLAAFKAASTEASEPPV
jgi:predicted DNA-binding ribbon-helix-helix protein